MNPAEDLLISFEDDPPTSGFGSPSFSRNRFTGLPEFNKFDCILGFSDKRKSRKDSPEDSSLYQPWWSQPIANSYPVSGTESPCYQYSGLSLNITPEMLSPSNPQCNLQEGKDALIKKIKAYQEVLKRKLNELEHLRKDHEQGENDCQLLKNYTENLLASKAVRNLN